MKTNTITLPAVGTLKTYHLKHGRFASGSRHEQTSDISHDTAEEYFAAALDRASLASKNYPSRVTWFGTDGKFGVVSLKRLLDNNAADYSAAMGVKTQRPEAVEALAKLRAAWEKREKEMTAENSEREAGRSAAEAAGYSESRSRAGLLTFRKGCLVLSREGGKWIVSKDRVGKVGIGETPEEALNSAGK